MKILIVTDAWHPQINGVVRSLTEVGKQAEAFGCAVDYLTPATYPTVAMPGYPEIRLALATPAQIAQRIEEIAPDCIHIATEGPLGILTRRYCIKRGRKIHDELSHALSGISFRAAAGAVLAACGIDAPLSFRRRRDDGIDRLAARRSCGTGL